MILHGTDTLCYTASALSFMFENLGKAVVLTGSQVSIHAATKTAVGLQEYYGVDCTWGVTEIVVAL